MDLGLSLGLTGGGPSSSTPMFYIDSVAGSDSNSGLSPAKAKATLSSITWQQGLRVGLKRGSVFREAVNISSDGAQLIAYGSASANRPVIINSTKITGTWTNTSGNIWSISLATQPDTVLLISNYSQTGLTKLWKYATTQTAPAAGQFGWASNVLYVYSTVDPGTLAEVSYTVASGGSVAVTIAANNNVLQDVAVWGATSDGVFIGQDKSGAVVRGCHLAGNTSDGCGSGGHANLLIERNLIEDNGYAARDGTGADGDGISCHGDAAARYATGVIRYNTIRRNRKSGIGNQLPCVIDSYGNYLDNNYWNIAIFTTTFTGGITLQHRFWNNVCIRRSNDAHGWQIPSAPTVATILRFWDNTNYSATTTTGAHGFRMTETSNLTVEMKNNIIVGFDRGIDVRSATILDLDYNCLNGNTTNYFDNSTGYLTGKTGSHSITSSPLFTDAANSDLTLQSGSPCLNAGVAVTGISTDYLGNPRPFGSAPDIGAYERQS